MNVREMHYDFKQKLNKADSQQRRNLLPMEIDKYLNEAQLSFIKTVANPKQQFALEAVQRSIDDISSIIMHSSVSAVQDHNAPNRYICDLNGLVPRFLYYISAEVLIKNNACCENGRMARVFIMKHTDLFHRNDFYSSSWMWSEVAGVFEGDRNLILFDDGGYGNEATFTIEDVYVDYIKVPNLIFYGGYNTIDGSLGVGDQPQDCELPFQVHSDVVDIAVLMAASNLMNPDVQAKIQKVQMNNQ